MPSVFDSKEPPLPAKADPVEAAKLKPPGQEVFKPRQRLDESKPEPPAPKVEAGPPPPTKAEVEAILGKRKRYRVGSDVAVHVNGCLTNLMKGQILSEQHWGTAVIPRLREQGVVLEEIVE